MVGRHSAEKSGLGYQKFWRLDSGFHDPRLLLLVPASSYGSVLLRAEGEEGPAGCATGGHELPILLDGIWMALSVASSLDLHGLDSR